MFSLLQKKPNFYNVAFSGKKMPRNPYKAIEDCNSSMKNSKYVEEKYQRNDDNIIP